MSYPGVDPGDVQMMEPVGTQEPSPGEPKHAVPEQQPEPEPKKDESQLDPVELQKVVEQAVQDQFAVTDGWKAKSVQFAIICPSGQRALLKRLDTMDLIEVGMVEEMDLFTKALMPVGFDQAGNPVEANKQQGFWQQIKDPEKRLRFLTLLNKLLEIGVVNPKVIDDGVSIIEKDGKKIVVQGTSIVNQSGVEYLQLEGGGMRRINDGEVRASAIDFTDKMAIFGEFNKPLEEIKPFRETPSGVASLDSVQGSGSSAQ